MEGFPCSKEMALLFQTGPFETQPVFFHHLHSMGSGQDLDQCLQHWSTTSAHPPSTRYAESVPVVVQICQGRSSQMACKLGGSIDSRADTC